MKSNKINKERRTIMTVTQVAFDIPPEIQAGIDAGVLLRFGGVV